VFHLPCRSDSQAVGERLDSNCLALCAQRSDECQTRIGSMQGLYRMLLIIQEEEMAKTSKSKTKRVTGKRTAGKGKGATIIELLRRKEGATLAELSKATSWQPHSVRGFLSAQVGKKLGLKLESTKREDGPRVYQIGS